LYEEYQLEISSGDILVFVTDGLTEGHLLKGEPYGYQFTDVVEAWAGNTAKTIGDKILDDWKAHKREEDTADDVSVIVVKINDYKNSRRGA